MKQTTEIIKWTQWFHLISVNWIVWLYYYLYGNNLKIVIWLLRLIWQKLINKSLRHCLCQLKIIVDAFLFSVHKYSMGAKHQQMFTGDKLQTCYVLIMWQISLQFISVAHKLSAVWGSDFWSTEFFLLFFQEIQEI